MNMQNAIVALAGAGQQRIGKKLDGSISAKWMKGGELELSEEKKKKAAEQSDPHVREAYTVVSREKHAAPTLIPLSPTAIPMQMIAPIPVAAPSPIEPTTPPKNELLTIAGINEKTAEQLEKLGINNVDDLAKASAGDLAKGLKVDLPTALKWIAMAEKLH